MEWYALFVETGKEEFVKNMIYKLFRGSLFRAVVPKRKLQERKQGKIYEVCKPLFPGYVLLYAEMNLETYYVLKRVPKYFRILNKHYYQNDNSRAYKVDRDMRIIVSEPIFSTIDKDEMALILQLIGTNDVIDYSTIYFDDKKVSVVEGPLKRLENYIKNIDKRKKRARIVMDFLGNVITLDVGIDIIECPKILIE